MNDVVLWDGVGGLRAWTRVGAAIQSLSHGKGDVDGGWATG